MDVLALVSFSTQLLYSSKQNVAPSAMGVTLTGPNPGPTPGGGPEKKQRFARRFNLPPLRTELSEIEKGSKRLVRGR
jgi:hypothetical protein